MNFAMQLLTAFTLSWVASTVAAGTVDPDETYMLQESVKVGRSQISMTLDEASLAAAVMRTATNHSSPLLLKDARRRAIFARVFAKLGLMVRSGGHVGSDQEALQDLFGIKREVVLSCGKTVLTDYAGFGLKMGNAIASIIDCAADSACLVKECLGLIGDSIDVLVTLLNLEQDCGKPLFEDFEDCSDDFKIVSTGSAPTKYRSGHFGFTPKQKNMASILWGTLATVTAGTAGVWGLVETCSSKNGASKPWHPGYSIAPTLFDVLDSGNQLRLIMKWTEPEETDNVIKCEIGSAFLSKVAALVQAISETVSHEQHGDGSDPKKGFEAACAGEIAGAVSALPDFAEKYCAYLDCDKGYHMAAFKSYAYGGTTTVAPALAPAAPAAPASAALAPAAPAAQQPAVAPSVVAPSAEAAASAPALDPAAPPPATDVAPPTAAEWKPTSTDTDPDLMGAIIIEEQKEKKATKTEAAAIKRLKDQIILDQHYNRELTDADFKMRARSEAFKEAEEKAKIQARSTVMDLGVVTANDEAQSLKKTRRNDAMKKLADAYLKKEYSDFSPDATADEEKAALDKAQEYLQENGYDAFATRQEAERIEEELQKALTKPPRSRKKNRAVRSAVKTSRK